MKRIILHLLLSLPIVASSQYAEIGILGGGMTYLGDISEVAFTAKETHPAIYGFVKFNANPYFGIKFLGGYGRISGDDQNSSRAFHNLRNLSFTSDIYEGGMVFEWNIAGFNAKRLRERFSPYVFAGVSVFHFNPRAFYQGQWHDLQPLGTEGQGTLSYPEREPYGLNQVGVPMGGGWRVALTEKWTLGMELKFTKTWTDYLDDVSTTYIDQDILIAENGILAWNLSNRTGEFLNTEPLDWDDQIQRGDPADKDWFLVLGITVSRNLLKPPFGWKGVRCPAFE